MLSIFKKYKVVRKDKFQNTINFKNRLLIENIELRKDLEIQSLKQHLEAKSSEINRLNEKINLLEENKLQERQDSLSWKPNTHTEQKSLQNEDLNDDNDEILDRYEKAKERQDKNIKRKLSKRERFIISLMSNGYVSVDKLKSELEGYDNKQEISPSSIHTTISKLNYQLKLRGINILKKRIENNSFLYKVDENEVSGILQKAIENI